MSGDTIKSGFGKGLVRGSRAHLLHVEKVKKLSARERERRVYWDTLRYDFNAADGDGLTDEWGPDGNGAAMARHLHR